MSSLSEAVRIRAMSAGDLARVVEIAEGLSNAPEWPEAAYRVALDPEHRPQRIALVAVDAENDAAVGFVIASLVPPEAELETIAVAVDAQRKGLGGRLLAALIRELRKSQVSGLILEVRASNRGAIWFYRAQGFEETGRRIRYYAEPEEDAILMRVQVG